MKIISKSTGHLSNIERYDLCDAFSESLSNKGLIICYALSTCESSKLVSLDLKAKHEEIGVPEKWHKKYTEVSFESSFGSLASFLNAYDDEDFGRWTATMSYQNIEVILSGERGKTEIGVSYPKNRKVNLLPWLSDVEAKTYGYNPYDKAVLDTLKNEFRLSDKRAVLAIQKLQTHPEIYDEFVLAVTSGKYVNGSGAVAVEGFTAEILSTNYPLSLLGAYNYLIYLRESPKEALEDLRKGLPRK